MNTARNPKPPLQSRLAPLHQESPATPAHFLFLASKWCDETCGPDCAHKKFAAVARCMTRDGYVYLARAGQKGAEDDELGVRHLPLHSPGLPAFGKLTAAVVLDDGDLLRRARHQYPEAMAYHFETSPSAMLKAAT